MELDMEEKKPRVVVYTKTKWIEGLDEINSEIAEEDDWTESEIQAKQIQLMEEKTERIADDYDFIRGGLTVTNEAGQTEMLGLVLPTVMYAEDLLMVTEEMIDPEPEGVNAYEHRLIVEVSEF